MTRVRVLVHALDRTGPPMLALAFVRWLRSARPEAAVEIVAFRGGPLEADAAAIAELAIVLDHHEPWDHAAVDERRAAELRARLAATCASVPDVTLLVSVAAGQSLPYLPASGPIVAWVVETGEDLHWIDGPVGVAGRVDEWVVGPDVVAEELSEHLARRARNESPGSGSGRAVPVARVPEFVDEPTVPSAATLDALRAALGADAETLLVVGAGIGTRRKGADLFVEVALRLDRIGRIDRRARFVWIGGESDPLVPLLVEEVARLGLTSVRFEPSTPRLTEYLAAADMFLHTAREDAFPLVCVSAAAVGTPVVCFSGVGGTDEMFGPHAAGAAYPDVSGVADAVVALADPAARAALGRAQQERVVGRYTTAATAPLLVDVLDRVAS